MQSNVRWNSIIAHLHQSLGIQSIIIFLLLSSELINMYAYTKETQSWTSSEAAQKKPPSTSESSKHAEMKTPLL